jgi:hypothetical protein
VALADVLTRGLLSETPAGFWSGREENTHTIEPARALAAETLKLERKPKAEA